MFGLCHQAIPGYNCCPLYIHHDFMHYTTIVTLTLIVAGLIQKHELATHPLHP